MNANRAIPFMQRTKKVETKGKNVELEIVSFIVAYYIRINKIKFNVYV